MLRHLLHLFGRAGIVHGRGVPGDMRLIDKPVGISSFDVIRRLRREWTQRGERAPKMGHAGTLDPLASGLMLVGVGKGTKELAGCLRLPKEYVAEICVGERRSTGDMEGDVLEEKAVKNISKGALHDVLTSMVGVHALAVPVYSAIKKDGVPMYKYARMATSGKKKPPEVPVRNMEVFESEYLGHACSNERCVVRVRFTVASGTYIRSLAEEVGRRLGYPATLKGLRRTKIGEFSVEDAQTV